MSNCASLWGDTWDIEGYIPPGSWQETPDEITVYGEKGALRIQHYANHLFLFTPKGPEKIKIKGDPAPYNFTNQ